MSKKRLKLDYTNIKIFKRKFYIPDELEVSFDSINNIFYFNGVNGSFSLKVDPRVKFKIIDNCLLMYTKFLSFFNMYSIRIDKIMLSLVGFTNMYLIIKGLGYSFNLVTSNSGIKSLILEIGLSHKIVLKIPEHIHIVMKDKKNKEIFIYGGNYDELRNFCYYIRSFKSPDEYKGKGILFRKEKVSLKIGKRLI